MKKSGCVFCRMESIKADVYYQGSSCIYFTPLNPIVEGHLLVVNTNHSEDFTDKTMLFAETAKAAADIAKRIGGDFNLITSKGSSATQTVFHCHIHLVPRREGDGLLLPWTNQEANE